MLSELATDTIVEIINDIIDNIDNKVNEKHIYKIDVKLVLDCYCQPIAAEWWFRNKEG